MAQLAGGQAPDVSLGSGAAAFDGGREDGEPSSMSNADGRKPKDAEASDARAEAQRAADGLKDQIAVRARIRHARDTLREHAGRQQEPRSLQR